MKRSILLFVSLGSFGLVACGGIGATDKLFNSGEGGSASSNSNGTASSAQGGAPTTASGSPAGGFSGVGGMSSVSSLMSTTATSLDQASSSAASMDASSSSGMMLPPTISCGTQSCPVEAMHACCYDGFKQGNPPYLKCVEGAPGQDGCQTEPTNGGFQTRITCQLPSDCLLAGGVCCGQRVSAGNGNDYYSNVGCTTQCNDVTLCDPQKPNSPQCPVEEGQQDVCQQSMLLPMGYFVCAQP